MRGGVGTVLTRVSGALLLLALAGCSNHTPAPTVTPTRVAALTPTRTPTPGLTTTPTAGPVPTAAPVPAIAWMRQFGSPAWDRANGVAVDREGNIIAAGATQGALPGQTLGGSWDAYVVKLSPAGKETLTLQFTDAVSLGALALAVDGTGTIFAAGNTEGSLPGRTSAGAWDAFVQAFSPSGAELWILQFGTAESEGVTGAAAGEGGDIFVVGHTYGVLPGQASAGSWDGFVVRIGLSAS